MSKGRQYSVYFMPLSIVKRYVHDNIIQRAFHHIEDIQFKGEEEYKRLVSQVFEMPIIKDYVKEYEVTFDESIWFPEDPTSYRNIVRVSCRFVSNITQYTITLDLRNGIDHYVPEEYK